MALKARTQLINRIIRDGNYHSYLEIGFLDDGDDPLNIPFVDCPVRTGVDPAYDGETSDDFFGAKQAHRPGIRYDCIFVDGLHHHEQAYRDIINSLNVLSHHGTLLIHDTNPQHYQQQVVPRHQQDWTGNVWRAVLQARLACPYHICYTLPVETGITIMQHPPASYPKYADRTLERFDPHTMTWETFCANRQKILNLRKTGLDGG